MDKSELDENISVVLDMEYDDMLHNNDRWTLTTNEQGYRNLSYPHYGTLVELFSTIQGIDELKKEFFDQLIKNIENGNKHVLCFYTLVECRVHQLMS